MFVALQVSHGTAEKILIKALDRLTVCGRGTIADSYVARNRLTDAAHPKIQIGLLATAVAVDRASAVAATRRCEDTPR